MINRRLFLPAHLPYCVSFHILKNLALWLVLGRSPMKMKLVLLCVFIMWSSLRWVVCFMFASCLQHNQHHHHQQEEQQQQQRQQRQQVQVLLLSIIIFFHPLLLSSPLYSLLNIFIVVVIAISPFMSSSNLKLNIVFIFLLMLNFSANVSVSSFDQGNFPSHLSKPLF